MAFWKLSRVPGLIPLDQAKASSLGTKPWRAFSPVSLGKKFPGWLGSPFWGPNLIPFQGLLQGVAWGLNWIGGKPRDQGLTFWPLAKTNTKGKGWGRLTTFFPTQGERRALVGSGVIARKWVGLGLFQEPLGWRIHLPGFSGGPGGERPPKGRG